MNKVNHVTRTLAMIVVALVITLVTPLVNAAPSEGDQTEKSWLQKQRQGVADRLQSSDSKLAQKVGGLVQGDPEQKRCKPLAEEALTTFDVAWQRAFNDPSDLVIPAPGQWMAALWIYAVIVVITLLALKRCKTEKGWSGWGIILIIGFMSCAFTEVRVAMWGDEIKPKVSQIMADFEQQCPKYQGQIIELATHKSWAARGADAAKTVWGWGKSWFVKAEEVPEEEMAWYKRWTYGDVREIAFEENRSASPFFQWWAGMLIMIGLALLHFKWWKGLWARRKSWRNMFLYTLLRDSTPDPATSTSVVAVQATPVVAQTTPTASPTVAPAPPAPDAPIALPPKGSALPPAPPAGGPRLIKGYALWDDL